jgi:ATP synthase F1 gamma subunit
MKQPNDLAHEEQAMGTLVELTSAFEGIASMKIALIKNQVLQSTQFFNELWGIYKQIKVDSIFSFGRDQDTQIKVLSKNLYIIVTAEGGFSGDIDLRLLELMLSTYQADTTDIIVIGHHGAIQLAQRGIAFKKYFKLPTKDQNINVTPITKEVQLYQSTTLFYQQYVSLMTQAVKSIDLTAAVNQIGESFNDNLDTISEKNYIFEPSPISVASHLERSMMQIAISQLILESKLAQYASRFRAMSASHQRADEEKANLRLEFNRSKRALKDERLKEIINGMKKARIGV